MDLPTPADLERFEIDAFSRLPSSEEARGLLEALVAEPDDIDARIRLYAFLVASRAPPDELFPHVEYFCAHAPSLRMTNSLGIVAAGNANWESLRRLWDVAIRERRDPLTLSNAIGFFLEWDLDRAREVSGDAITAHPENAELHVLRGRVHLRGLELGRVGFSADVAATSLLRAHELSPRLPILGLAAMGALQAGTRGRARQFAELAISTANARFSQEQHLGHTVLGCLALPDNVEVAESELAASVVDFDYHGPSMRLARALAQIGRKDMVRAYILASKERWDGPRERCDGWLRALDCGNIAELANVGS